MGLAISSRRGTTRRPRQAIIEFVGRVTKDGTSTFVPLEERVAVFDNDGTLWSEKPMPAWWSSTTQETTVW